MEDDDLIWTLAASAVTFGAAAVAKKLLSRGWTARRGLVPGAPGDGRTNWGEAVAFAVVSGVVVGLARLVAERGIQAARGRRTSPA